MTSNTMLSRLERERSIVEVVITNESNLALYFPEAGNLNDSNADMCSDVARPSSSDSGDLFDLSDRSNISYFCYFPTISTTVFTDLSVTTTPILLFGACYAIMHTIYSNMRLDGAHQFVVSMMRIRCIRLNTIGC